MRIVFLSNHVAPYRVSTLVELRQMVERLDIVLSSTDCAPGLPEHDIGVHFLPSLKIPQRRRHANGYDERYEVHVPRAVIATLRRLDPNCVVAPEFGLRTAMAAAYCVLHRRPLVIHADLSEEYEQGRGVARITLRKALLRLSDRVLANGRSAARYVQSLGYDPARISLLPYATDLDRFGHVPRPPAPDGTLRLLYVGQLIERKGLEPFVQALAQTLAQRGDLHDLKVTLTLAGRGEREAALRALSLPANLSLRLTGPVPYRDLDALYAGHDVFVMPTLSDTWGLVVNESMASGLPILGSLQSQAVLEMVEDGKQGWVFDARSPASLHDAIARCLDCGAAARRQLGLSARVRASHYSPAHSAQQIVDACRRALEARRGGTGREPAVAKDD
jgi:glycosyltransferase involved in cell wall biosynthesis